MAAQGSHVAGELGDLMSQASKVIEATRDDESADVTAAQFHMLRYIANHPASTVGAISNALSIRQSSATNLLARLHKKGLVTKRGLRSDRRLVRISLTESGSKTLERLAAQRDKLLSKVLASMPKSEQKKLLDGLDGFVRAAHQVGILAGGACPICGADTVCDCVRKQVEEFR